MSNPTREVVAGYIGMADRLFKAAYWRLDEDPSHFPVAEPDRLLLQEYDDIRLLAHRKFTSGGLFFGKQCNVSLRLRLLRHKNVNYFYIGGFGILSHQTPSYFHVDILQPEYFLEAYGKHIPEKLLHPKDLTKFKKTGRLWIITWLVELKTLFENYDDLALKMGYSRMFTPYV